MSEPGKWDEFERLGESEVRHALATSRWGEVRAAMAKQWLELQASNLRDEREEATLSETRRSNELAKEANTFAREATAAAAEANSIAREASASAKRTADAARTNNIIAAAALAAAIIAIVVSLIGLAHK